ncbi:MAG: 2-oxo acid dehydrogenase subunit E2, partial [Geminicoccaceae bacterium]|nr:2-oxo acid dehydrogenase subunit E2 [Geminicoccaceae bacterium]
VEELLVAPGQKVPVGTPLARIRAPGEPAAAAPAAPPPPARPAPAATPPAPAPTLAPPSVAPVAPRAAVAPAAAALKVSPAARRRAIELGVPLERIHGTGPEGAVTVADVEAAARGAAAEPPTPPPAPAEAAPAAAEAAPPPAAAKPAARRGFDPAEMRKAIAAAMSRSKREIPHYYLESTVEMRRALAFLEAVNRERPPPERLLPATLLLKATALALREVPELNGFWLEGGFRPGPGIHPGWAIALRGGGLIAPAIRDADRLALPELMARLRDLVARARSGGLKSSELGDATVTITSLGERGAEAVFPVIYPPQVAMVGFGRILTRPWVDEEGGLVARPLVRVSLAADHRASDGHLGSRLLAAIEELLQKPEQL